MRFFALSVICVVQLVGGALAFVPCSPALFGRFPSIKKQSSMAIQLNLQGFSSLVLSGEVESWRQYVPLVVATGVIIDILLGSPLANTVMAPLRAGAEKEEKENSIGGGRTQQQQQEQRSRERIDTTAVAQAAVDKAKNTLELKRFLDERKTDWDKMEDMKKKLDADMTKMDVDLETRAQDLDRRANKN
jgi:hypothetical protein